MTKKNPIYGQGSGEYKKTETEKYDPVQERYRNGSHYRRGPKNTDYRVIPPQSHLEVYDSQIGQLYDKERKNSLDDRSYRSISGGSEEEEFQSNYPKRKDYSGRGPKGYERSDAKIWEDVCDALANAPEIDASEMEVSVDDSTVLLHGVVNSREEAWRAEQIAWDIPGVAEVRNEVDIKYF